MISVGEKEEIPLINNPGERTDTAVPMTLT